MNKKGMTLIELLVYMAIAALLLAPVIMLMQNSSVNMARDAVTTDLRISGRDILNIMYEDIRNTGFKLIDATGTVDTVATFIVINPNPSATPHVITDDPSSFRPGDAGSDGAFDALTIRKGRLHHTTGGWEGYDTVMYYVSGDTLKRTSAKFTGNSGSYDTPPSQTQNIATNVEALQFQYSADLSDWNDAPAPVPSNPPPPAPQLPPSSANRKDVKYIKISVITKDDKKLAPTNAPPQFWQDYNSRPNYATHYLTYLPNDQHKYLRELSEIVVPIPNNGLFPQ
jgi:prepilin-type N-terminal cleavage/methylation domain-containing protein